MTSAPPRGDGRPRLTMAPAGPSPDPFGIDLEYRREWLPLLRFFYERYWRVEVSGIEHVPADGPALVAANHSGAVPADAFMIAVALELEHPRRRALRVLYDKFVDALPWIGPLYHRLGGVPSSFANAELLLRRRELLAIFPEGIAGVEKRWVDRYQLRPFKTGTARLSIATASPIVPVAIVGAEEAYPVVARLYRAGRVVGVPWIPVTPLFPLCGVAGALPLPTKWRMRFCPPIMPPAAAPDDEDAVAELTASVRRSIAVAVGDLLLTRRGIFV
jgi:1-acyl-sn-glycerol-3-phosphate acyltransferase